MSSSQSTTSDSPALGSRENHWGDDGTATHDRGHSECRGTDAAEFVAHQLALRFLAPICEETGRELSDPTLYLPKQEDIGCGYTREFRQARHRRRVEPESGRINWGETTSTDVPEFGYETYKRCVHTYLAERDGSLLNAESFLKYADRVWSDPQFGSKDSLAQFIAHVRDQEDT